MQDRIKILLADDSSVVRQMLKETLNAEPDMEVVHALANGQQVVERVKSGRIDVVVLDIEMPEVDGLQATKGIRKFNKGVPIVIFSSLANAGGRTVLKALLAGASDCVAKPANTGRVQDAIGHIQSELVPLIRSLSRAETGADGSAYLSEQCSVVPPAGGFEPASAFDVVTIGVSTGGPNALSQMLQMMPALFPLPILIVQHMPPKFTRLLADRLNSECPLTVLEAADGQTAEANHVYIAPGGQHLRLTGPAPSLQMVLNDDRPINSCRPSADELFRSATMACGNRVLAVMLTGMGCDGVAGIRDIKEAGGYVIAQDEATSAVWGMPGEVVNQGLADQVSSLDRIAGELVRLAPSKQLAHSG